MCYFFFCFLEEYVKIDVITSFKHLEDFTAETIWDYRVSLLSVWWESL